MMDLYDFLRLAKAYNNLGWAVQEQMDTYIESGDNENTRLNPNAVREIENFLRKLGNAGVDTDGLGDE